MDSRVIIGRAGSPLLNNAAISRSKIQRHIAVDRPIFNLANKCRSSKDQQKIAVGIPGTGLFSSRKNCLISRRSKTGVATFAGGGEVGGLLPLGLDFLTFLAATVLVIPVFKSAKVSPILGFLFSGLVLGQLGQVSKTL